MGKLITIAGNAGVGKTTLTRRLCRLDNFVMCLEQHEERPFQKLFSRDRRRYALANQVDFLLYRAKQEQLIRENPLNGVQDGGLDQDFYVFTRLFFEKGYLAAEEFDLCRRVYSMLRRSLPPPDLIVRLVAPLDVITDRFTRRSRSMEIAALADLEVIEVLLEDWMAQVTSTRVISVDVGADSFDYSQTCEQVRAWIEAKW